MQWNPTIQCVAKSTNLAALHENSLVKTIHPCRVIVCIAAVSGVSFLSFSQVVGQDLVDNELVLEAVNQEAFELLEELKQGEGLVDMQGFEEQLRLVNAKWNEAKVKVKHRYIHFYRFLAPSFMLSFSTSRYLDMEYCSISLTFSLRFPLGGVP